MLGIRAPNYDTYGLLRKVREVSMKRLTIGLLAHVDAGKTTLAENILFNTNSIRTKGRVDHKDTTLDNHNIERTRGITIFSKLSHLQLDDTYICMMDTPGHIDFSYEMSRGIDALDYGILVINGTEPLNKHTKDIFQRLKESGIPVFIFVNKMDISYIEKNDILEELTNELSDGCIEFLKDSNQEEFYENIASLDEKLIDKFIETKSLSDDDIRRMIINRKVYPVCFGAALKNEGVDNLIYMLDKYTSDVYKNTENQPLCGKAVKIECTNKNERLTYIKITSGVLKVKDSINIDNESDKINQIRLYQGGKYELLSEAYPGMTVAVTGLNKICAGMKIENYRANLELIDESFSQHSVFQIILPENLDTKKVYNTISALNDEMPDLNIRFNEHLGIDVNIMGDVQKQVVTEIIKERYGIDAEFGNIDYIDEDLPEDELEELYDNSSLGDEDNYEETYYQTSRYIDKDGNYDLDRELKDIFEKTYGKIKERKNYDSYSQKYQKCEKKVEKNISYLLIDGYNVIFAIDYLKELAKLNFDSARQKLMDMVSNYAGTIDDEVMVVFDAYKVKGNTGSVLKYHNITVIYTKEAETADAYIEKFAHNNGRKYDVTVVTSDGLEQIIIRGAGCRLISSREFAVIMRERMQKLREFYDAVKDKGKTYLFDSLNLDLQNQLEDVRLGFIEFEQIKDDVDE